MHRAIAGSQQNDTWQGTNGAPVDGFVSLHLIDQLVDHLDESSWTLWQTTALWIGARAAEWAQQCQSGIVGDEHPAPAAL